MTPRRSTAVDSSVEAPEVQKVDAKKPRVWADVAKQIQAMRAEGASVPEICEKLEVSYVLVNQLILQSYKMAIATDQVFERRKRCGWGLKSKKKGAPKSPFPFDPLSISRRWSRRGC